jgi:branched-subunit amino acid aminotransferase/4-amino-4-deoxychorismate lyase
LIIGVTRKTVIELCKALNIVCLERRISLTEFYAADEVFTTGTMGELTPVCEIDGRMIGEGVYPGVTLKLLQSAYRQLTETEGVPLPF